MSMWICHAVEQTTKQSTTTAFHSSNEFLFAQHIVFLYSYAHTNSIIVLICLSRACSFFYWHLLLPLQQISVQIIFGHFDFPLHVLFSVLVYGQFIFHTIFRHNKFVRLNCSNTERLPTLGFKIYDGICQVKIYI